jgi:hypothetical protein
MFTAKQTTKIIGILIMHPDVVPHSKTNHTNIYLILATYKESVNARGNNRVGVRE